MKLLRYKHFSAFLPKSTFCYSNLSANMMSVLLITSDISHHYRVMCCYNFIEMLILILQGKLRVITGRYKQIVLKF